MLSTKLFKALAAPKWTSLRVLSTTPAVKDSKHGPSFDDIHFPLMSDRPIEKPRTDADIFTNEKGQERDHVNFPRRTVPLEPGKVRLMIFPEEWFTAFHSKTGVTGPYMFGIGLSTFLMSKEIWVLEHDFYCGLAMVAVLGTVAKMYGPAIRASMRKDVDEHTAELKAIRQDEVDRCMAQVQEEEKKQWMASSYQELIEAKKENVALQVEAEYRSRLQDAYQQVKRRLDYQLEITNVMRRTEQKHMVNWIVDSVRKSITPKQEDDALKKCIADLKALAK